MTDDRIAAGFGKQDQVNRGLERDKTEPSPLDKDKLAECFKKYLEWWEKPARDGGGLGR